MTNLYYPRYDPYGTCAPISMCLSTVMEDQCESAAEGGDAAPWIGSLRQPFTTPGQYLI